MLTVRRKLIFRWKLQSLYCSVRHFFCAYPIIFGFLVACQLSPNVEEVAWYACELGFK
ncbi:hypothetical protein BKA82DRAFT_1002541 [Pisolithus tinctorius]|uniref:Uncharacterized protein n=1 Tax=Pisolithus tinctorius Marx 270 TaxID=870435 RepID=A0A0C3P4A6_PISTI|nr:hypothetical protein BKA82DRAFT_1002541 [Pisolithus tinctorius]KIO02114.1 hypothetical protein M404DRAFT_1002541 [Pisolithus tinctorius Marx 270]